MKSPIQKCPKLPSSSFNLRRSPVLFNCGTIERQRISAQLFQQPMYLIIALCQMEDGPRAKTQCPKRRKGNSGECLPFLGGRIVHRREKTKKDGGKIKNEKIP